MADAGPRLRARWSIALGRRALPANDVIRWALAALERRVLLVIQRLFGGMANGHNAHDRDIFGHVKRAA